MKTPKVLALSLQATQRHNLNGTPTLLLAPTTTRTEPSAIQPHPPTLQVASLRALTVAQAERLAELQRRTMATQVLEMMVRVGFTAPVLLRSTDPSPRFFFVLTEELPIKGEKRREAG